MLTIGTSGWSYPKGVGTWDGTFSYPSDDGSVLILHGSGNAARGLCLGEGVAASQEKRSQSQK